MRSSLVVAALAPCVLMLAACGAPIPTESGNFVPEATAAPRPAPMRRTPPPVDTSAVLGKGPFMPSSDLGMRDPTRALDAAPNEFRVYFRTSAGNFAVDCHRDWAPNGADRLYNLVQIGFFDDVAFYRVVSQPQPFVAQFGIHGDPAVNDAWAHAQIPPDPVVQSNERGTLTFAMAGRPDTRVTQLFFNLTNNDRLDKLGFAPVCAVVDDGMATLDKLYGGYGEKPTRDQAKISGGGNVLLRRDYPELDYIATARVVPKSAVLGPDLPAVPSSSPGR